MLKTEDTTDRPHLSLVNLQKDFNRPNPGTFTFDERALGKGSWVCIINTGYNWEQFPEVSTPAPSSSSTVLVTVAR